MKLSPIPRTFTRTIAERNLLFLLGSHQRRVRIRVGAPVQDVTTAAGRDWRCPIQIIGLGIRGAKRGVGVDSLQALIHALKTVEVEIRAAQKHHGGHFVWLGERWHGVPDIQLTLPEFVQRPNKAPLQPASRARKAGVKRKPPVRAARG